MLSFTIFLHPDLFITLPVPRYRSFRLLYSTGAKNALGLREQEFLFPLAATSDNKADIFSVIFCTKNFNSVSLTLEWSGLPLECLDDSLQFGFIVRIHHVLFSSCAEKYVRFDFFSHPQFWNDYKTTHSQSKNNLINKWTNYWTTTSQLTSYPHSPLRSVSD